MVLSCKLNKGIAGKNKGRCKELHRKNRHAEKKYRERNKPEVGQKNPHSH